MCSVVEVQRELAALLDGIPFVVPSPPLHPGDQVPVIVWRRGPAAAVLFISHDHAEAEDDDDEVEDDEPFSVWIETYQRINDVWICDMSGGSGWPVPYGERPKLARPSLTGFLRD